MKRLGVIGTMVWDTIHQRDPGRSEPVEEWGGICYALSAFEATAPDGWELLPIIKVGGDLRERANDYLRGLSGIASLEGVRTVPERNNRVELFYQDRSRRCEKLTGGVPGWSWEELAPLARSCDAVYVNFVAGWELDLSSAQGLRAGFRGPVYSDLHSIFLGVGADGVREPRPLAAWREWLRCFDLVQLNEDELETLAGALGDPWKVAAEVVGEGTRALLVTLGERGAAWVAAAGFDGLELEAGEPPALRPGMPATTGFAPTRLVVPDPDPTGCGDVWGMTCFASLLGGATLREAVERSNTLAARSAAHRGASQLGRLLADTSPILSGR
jgi:hypothetical protein